MSHVYFTKLLKFIEENPNQATMDSQVLLRQLKGKHLVAYFYTRNNTLECTKEAWDFSFLYQEFKKHNTEIIGISRNNVAAHEKFKLQHGLHFELISDFKGDLCQEFKVVKKIWQLGISRLIDGRTTFLFHRDGRLVLEWRNVIVTGHANDVLEVVKGIENE